MIQKNQIMARRSFGAPDEIPLELLPYRCLSPSTPVVMQIADQSCFDMWGCALQRKISDVRYTLMRDAAPGDGAVCSNRQFPTISQYLFTTISYLETTEGPGSFSGGRLSSLIKKFLELQEYRENAAASQVLNPRPPSPPPPGPHWLCPDSDTSWRGV
jgi:hypothetical protein